MTLALRFLGVGSAQAVELGSAAAVLERDGQPLLLIDCGPEALTAYLDRYGALPPAIYITHAHMDHVGYLPALARNGFDGPVWCTPGTRELAEIVMRDAAKLQELEAQDANERGYSKHSPALPLYTTADVEDLLPQFVALEYDTDFELTGDERPGFTPDADQTVTIRLSRAGHILGSASVNLWTPTATVLFSGDLPAVLGAVLGLVTGLIVLALAGLIAYRIWGVELMRAAMVPGEEFKAVRTVNDGVEAVYRLVQPAA